MMLRKLAMLTMAMALSGCISQSQVQSKYVKAQGLCRVEASSAIIEGDSNQSVGKAFSDCMRTAGWNVASPKTGAVTTNPPSGSPSTDPIASAAKPTQPTAAANPPSGAPSVKPSAAAARAPVAEPTAIYSPARPVNTPVPEYGTGGGRNF